MLDIALARWVENSGIYRGMKSIERTDYRAGEIRGVQDANFQAAGAMGWAVGQAAIR